ISSAHNRCRSLASSMIARAGRVTLELCSASLEVSAMEISFDWVVPILRIFDVAKADEFYQGFLGFSVDWEHRNVPSGPLYRQVSRGGLILHLSEHHGDGSPGARVRVMMRGVKAFHAEISSKGYRYMRPGL